MKDPGPLAALYAALIIAVLYSQGGVFRPIASLIILATLLTPVDNHDALLTGLVKYLTSLLTTPIR